MRSGMRERRTSCANRLLQRSLVKRLRFAPALSCLACRLNSGTTRLVMMVLLILENAKATSPCGAQALRPVHKSRIKLWTTQHEGAQYHRMGPEALVA